MVRRWFAQISYPLSIALALLCVAASKPKPQVRRAIAVEDEPDFTAFEQSSDSYSSVVPKTRAASVLVEDARSGEVFYEKNADATRAAASTQKLLTALVIAEDGYLDQPVTVQPIDTWAEPVKLNIKPGETYQRIDLLRALLVKSPNDVARCLARNNAGSIEAFAEK